MLPPVVALLPAAALGAGFPPRSWIRSWVFGPAVIGRKHFGMEFLASLGLLALAALVPALARRRAALAAGAGRGPGAAIRCGGVRITRISTEPGGPLSPNPPPRSFRSGEQAEQSSGAPPPRRKNGQPPFSILLVEDHEDTADFLSLLLRRQSYLVRTANSVAGAIKEAAGEPFDLLISDLSLPDGDGLDLIRSLRESREISGIALSGFASEVDVQTSREAGFAEHLLKPIDLQRLLQVIRRYADRAGAAP